MWRRLTSVLAACVLVVGGLSADDVASERTYATGWKQPADLDAMKAAKAIEQGLAHYPISFPASFDWSERHVVPPVEDQGNCGSCWCFAGTGISTMSAIKAGWGKADGSFRLAEQYVLDCGQNGGCSGDDHSSVFKMAVGKGLPASYGPYVAHRAACKQGSDFIRFKTWGYCDPKASGPASVESIKAALLAHGPVSTTIAADNRLASFSGQGVFDGHSHSLNHQVIITGWADDKQAWRMRNSWSQKWADGGYAWIKWGANDIGTDAAWIDADAAPHPEGPVFDWLACLWHCVRAFVVGLVVAGLAYVVWVVYQKLKP